MWIKDIYGGIVNSDNIEAIYISNEKIKHQYIVIAKQASTEHFGENYNYVLGTYSTEQEAIDYINELYTKKL